ncbi:MAG: LysM peptidoglycan-binding domain-containing protein [Opitutales bacterium]
MENKNKSFLSFAIALVALALGAASLFLSINSVQNQKVNNANLEEKLDKAHAAAIDSKNSTSEIASLKKEIASLKDAIKQNYDASNKNMRDAFEYHSKPINANKALISENRQLIIANQNAIKELAQRQVVAPAPEPTPAITSTASTAQASTPASEDDAEYITYTIKSGDYFSKLAKQFKVSIEAIEEANPNVSSNALRIGQKIKIPKAQ